MAAYKFDGTVEAVRQFARRSEVPFTSERKMVDRRRRGRGRGHLPRRQGSAGRFAAALHQDAGRRRARTPLM
ncbi:MAG: hypothetical protein ABWY39_02260 [Mycobacterium sp.]